MNFKSSEIINLFARIPSEDQPEFLNKLMGETNYSDLAGLFLSQVMDSDLEGAAKTRGEIIGLVEPVVTEWLEKKGREKTFSLLLGVEARLA